MPVLIALFLWIFAAHPVHVAVTTLEINRDKKEILVSQKVYKDDFLLLFYHLFEKIIKLEADKDLSAGDLSLINTYFNAAFILESGKEKLPLEFQRKEQDGDLLWLYYKISLPSNKIESLTLTNALLLDLFEDQTNLVIVKDGPAEKGYTFNYHNFKSEIALQ